MKTVRIAALVVSMAAFAASNFTTLWWVCDAMGLFMVGVALLAHFLIQEEARPRVRKIS